MTEQTNPDPWGSTVTPMAIALEPIKYSREIDTASVEVIHFPYHDVWAVYVRSSNIYGAQWSAGGLKSREQAEALAEKAAPLVLALAEQMEDGDE